MKIDIKHTYDAQLIDPLLEAVGRRNRIDVMLEKHEARYYLAMANGLLGVAALSKVTSTHRNTELKLAVHPDFQGQGVGGALVDYVVGDYETLGANAIVASTIVNSVSERILRSRGFETDTSEFVQKLAKRSAYPRTFLIYRSNR